jgi:hypothetical protein
MYFKPDSDMSHCKETINSKHKELLFIYCRRKIFLCAVLNKRH